MLDLSTIERLANQVWDLFDEFVMTLLSGMTVLVYVMMGLAIFALAIAIGISAIAAIRGRFGVKQRPEHLDQEPPTTKKQ